ncbi:MAG: hypothetical protein R3348_06360 [Xanthomonadales bacterium]|nr:hypothetical protein [Xanthomonadales bacterium]
MLDHSMRPDQSGVILLTDRQWNDWPVLEAVPTGPTVPEASLAVLQKLAVRLNTPLLIREYLISDGKVQGQKSWGFGPPEFREAVRQVSDLTGAVRTQPRSSRARAADPSNDI